MSTDTCSVLCLFVAIYGFMENQRAPCSLFVCRLNSAYILFACSLLTFCTLVSPLLLHFSNPLSEPFLPPPSSTSLSLHICLVSLQWRASGWSGGHGRDAAWRATQGPSRGRGAAVLRCTAGLNVKAPIRRAGTAPTLPAAVRRTNECLVFTLTRSRRPSCKHGNMHYLWIGTWFGVSVCFGPRRTKTLAF